jgi:hypothetical protein
MSSRQVSVSTSPCKKHHDNNMTIGDATYGLIWFYHLH